MSNVIGFDDSPFPQHHRGDVPLVGVVCARTRLDGIVVGRVRRDGKNSTRSMIELVRRSRFGQHIQAVFLQGITVAGFNVVDVHELSQSLELPVLAIARKLPNFNRIRRALSQRVRGGEAKWRLLERAGEMERLGGVWVQRVGIDARSARQLLRVTTLHGNLPEPLRLAHLIAGAIATGESRGGA